MQAHGQTMPWAVPVTEGAQDTRRQWLLRLRQWLVGRATCNGATSPVALDDNWDPRRERFRPLTTQSAIDHIAAQGGQRWLVTIHSATL